MFLQKTHVAPSWIHGLGLFAAEPIKAGEPIRIPSPALTLHWSQDDFLSLPQEDRKVIAHYGYFHKEQSMWHFSAEDIRYVNHSTTPTVGRIVDSDGVYALADMSEWTEITQNYADCEEVRNF